LIANNGSSSPLPSPVSVPALAKQYGMEELREYLARSRRAIDRMRGWRFAAGRPEGGCEMRGVGAGCCWLSQSQDRQRLRQFPEPGEWPCFRRDGGLVARSPARGQMSEPRIVWRRFVGLLATS
jgi:hypothetical protein